ncbi:adenylyltransferase and sulfurtransferase [Nematocida displodere]|uniref:Adenylyltransferase and sulfurtransferase n=1 Tax=Nematocida displodere TaxID=1805483 RepID=A0A177EIM9_9MICR|nr:adenylyltransferase and sulfurtransferase [Nematocida displodere]
MTTSKEDAIPETTARSVCPVVSESVSLFSSSLPLSLVERFSRQMIVGSVGVSGQKKLLATRVLVVGCGGLGGPTLLYLNAMGFGGLGISDSDTVEDSNLNRQILFTEGMVGRSKVDSAVETLSSLNSSTEFFKHPAITKENLWPIGASYDLIVDCADSRALRYLLSDYSSVRGIPFICGSSLRWEGSVYHLHNYCYRCIYPKASSGKLDTCASAGIIGSVCGVVGSAMATEVLKSVLGLSTDSYLVQINALKNEWMKVSLGAKALCWVCTSKQTRTKGEMQAQIVMGEDVYLPPTILSTTPTATPTTRIATPKHSTPTATPKHSTQGVAVCSGAGEGLPGNTVTWATILAEPGKYLLVDIRSKAEASILSVSSAISLPLSEIIDHHQKALVRLHKKAKQRTIALFCRNGTTSLKFAPLLKAVNVFGGVSGYLAGSHG